MTFLNGYNCSELYYYRPKIWRTKIKWRCCKKFNGPVISNMRCVGATHPRCPLPKQVLQLDLFEEIK
jgi:hypothetical protein